jgi:hypothetical protein
MYSLRTVTGGNTSSKEKIVDVKYDWVSGYIISGLVTWFTLFTCAFGFIIGFWILLFYLDLLDGGENYIHALDDVSLILIFVFYMWVNDSLGGYTTRPELYRRLLNKIPVLCGTLMCLLATSPDPRSKISQSMDQTEEILRGIIFYSYKIFHKKDRSKFVFSANPIIESRCHNMAPRAVVSMLITELHIKNTLMEKKGLIKSGDMYMMSEEIRHVSRVMEDVDVGEHVFMPVVFKNHTRFILAIYFILWIPFKMVLTIGWVSALVYPLLMDMLTGITIIRYWLGDPFDKNRPWKLMDYRAWRDEFMLRISEDVANIKDRFINYAVDNYENNDNNS